MKRVDHIKMRDRIFRLLPKHPVDIVKVIAEEFGVSRQTAHAHLTRLIKEGLVESSGNTRTRTYKLAERGQRYVLRTATDRDEDQVWRDKVAQHLRDLPDNVFKICGYGFSEMYNNIVDHSGSPEAILSITRSGNDVIIALHDDGVGIFDNIRTKLGLDDNRQAILELSKGKLTTDPSRHSGEGIYFTSRAFDEFSILSSDLFFHHTVDNEDWLIEHQTENAFGTTVIMKIAVDSPRQMAEIYRKSEAENEDGDFAFSRTHVPLRLAVMGTENLVSRSQAKRVLRRFDRFQEVMLDFAGLEEVGQAFADEIFRVFKLAHPEITVVAIRANEQIRRMIGRAQAALKESLASD